MAGDKDDRKVGGQKADTNAAKDRMTAAAMISVAGIASCARLCQPRRNASKGTVPVRTDSTKARTSAKWPISLIILTKLHLQRIAGLSISRGLVQHKPP